MNDTLLSQQEINSLLQKNEELNSYPYITDEEKDILMEIGNISMSAAAMLLTDMLGREVSLTAVQLKATAPSMLLSGLDQPHVALYGRFHGGLSGPFVIMLREADSSAVSTPVSDSMNRIADAVCDAVAKLIKRDVKFSASGTEVIASNSDLGKLGISENTELVKIEYGFKIKGSLDSFMQLVLPLDTARAIIGELMKDEMVQEVKEPEPPAEQEASKRTVPVQRPQFGELEAKPSSGQRQNIDLILDVPLELSVVLGSTKKSIKEILSLNPGSVVELGKYTEEPLEVYVNGKLIAHGEVVVINENFGIRITSIISAAERVKRL
ncbi:MAG TPA: flagellar motor switch protein FliN [Candidatus Atribacteria bacterium]|nr:flagellar motor switch protein FliN [Candidatus Atribacteria bacterium]